MKDTDRYTIISADAHAGLPCEEYRPYLEPRYFEAFDAFLAERHAQRDHADEVELRLHHQLGDDARRRAAGRVRRRATRQGARRGWSRRGGDLRRRRRDHRDGIATVRCRPVGGYHRGSRSSRSRARARTTASSSTSVRRVPTVGRVSGSCRSVTTSNAASRRSSGWPTSRECAGSWCRRCGATACRTTIPTTTRCGRRARRRASPCTRIPVTRLARR